MSTNQDPQRTTILLDSKSADSSRTTQILNSPTRETSVMPSHDPGRTTSVMLGKATEQVACLLTEETIIDGYSVERTITENTGEATLLQAEKDGTQYALKMYHKASNRSKNFVIG